MIAGAIVILITSPGAIDERFAAVVSAYQALYQGSFGDLQSLSQTLVRVGPLIFAGLSVALAYRAGLFNIGAGGQLAVGAMTACIIALKLSMLPSWLLVPLMILASMTAGAIWGGIVGLLKAWRGAHEVVTTIMLNWIAFYGSDYLINGPFKNPSQANQTPAIPSQATLPSIATVYNATLGNVLGKVDTTLYNIDVTILFALLALIVYWFLTSRTTFGYEVRVIGQNLKAARYAGIPTRRNLTMAMAIAGAFAGLAGSLYLMGQPPYYLTSTNFALNPTGFDAIGVALLGQTTAVGVLLGSLLFGGLRQGAGLMQLSAGVPGDLVYILQALVLFSIATEILPALRRLFPSWLTLSMRRSPPAAAGVVASPAVQNGNGENGAANTASTDPTQQVAPIAEQSRSQRGEQE